MSTCGVCGEEECGCNQTQVYLFEGGPLDGCKLEAPESVVLADIIVGTLAGDDGNKETAHRYSFINQWTANGVVYSYMGHITQRSVTMAAMNAVFSVPKREPLDVSELPPPSFNPSPNSDVSRGFDMGNLDETDEEREQDGEGWKNNR